MKKSLSANSKPIDTESFIRVRHSKIHGNGVFAVRKIAEGTRVLEYEGKRITEKQAERRFGLDADNPHQIGRAHV